MKHLTYQDLLQQLRQLPEITLMELLEINSEELVDRFLDKIEEKQDWLFKEFEDWEEDDYR